MNSVRTRNGEKPIGLPSDVSDEGKELNVTSVQSLVLTTKGEDTTKLLILGIFIGYESVHPETHFGRSQSTTLGEGLPEWSGFGVGDGVEGKAHDTGVGAV